MKQPDIIILGAGAAGLMCAITAANRGRSVIVLEKSNKVGKKILMSGGGRCNFTNMYTTPDNFISNNPHFCKSALSRYNPWDFIALVEKHKIPYHEKTKGQLFCDGSSKEIVAMLLKECKDAGVQIITQCETYKIETGFALSTNKGKFACESLVVATGALSIPTLGGSGAGYDIAEQFGLTLIPKRAGLVPLTFTDSFKTLSEKLSGTSINAEIKSGNTSFQDDILFTHRGLSGPAVLQISSYWAPGEVISLNLLPQYDALDGIFTLQKEHGKAFLKNILMKDLPKQLVLELQAMWWPTFEATPLAEIPKEALKNIASNLFSWKLKPAGTEGYRTAEVTLGGVDTSHLSSKTLSCNQNDKLYFIGEVIDVTGHLGGFNFQWAWASGYAAGLSA